MTQLSHTLRMINAEFIERKFYAAELAVAHKERKSDLLEISKLILDAYSRLHERLQMTKGLYYNEYTEMEKSNRNALVKKTLKNEKEYLGWLHNFIREFSGS